MASETTAATVMPRDFLDVDSLLSDEEREIRDVVRAFVSDRVVPNVGEWFEQATIPRELARELGALGVLGMHLEGYGCAGASATAYGLTCLELEAGDSGVRSLVSVQGSLAMYAIHRWGSEEQKQQWLPQMAAGEAIGCFGLTEPDAGSDPGSMRTRARRDGADWILHGQKMWITNGSIADVAVVWARTDDGIRGFLVPKDTRGFSTQEIHKKLSLRASVTSELLLDDVRLPADALLPEATSLRGPLSCLNEARYGIVWGAIGAARACFEAALAYSQERIVFGKPIAATQLQQAKLADMATEVNRGILLALHLGRLKDAGRLAPEQVSMGKLANVNAALHVARTARQVLGANGITLEYPVIRHMNNLESVVTYEGTADVHALVIGGALTGQPGVPLRPRRREHDRIGTEHHHPARARRAAPRDRRRRAAAGRADRPGGVRRTARRQHRAGARGAAHPRAGGAGHLPPTAWLLRDTRWRSPTSRRSTSSGRCSRRAPPATRSGASTTLGLERILLAATDFVDAVDTADVAAELEANRRFHLTILDSPDQPHTMRMIRQLWDSTEAYRALYYNLPEERRSAVDAHDRILAALREATPCGSSTSSMPTATGR